MNGIPLVLHTTEQQMSTAMKRISLILLVTITVLGFTGCEVAIIEPDFIPPSPPRNIYTETGDNYIVITWSSSPDRDVDGYRVYVSSSYNGHYDLIGTTHGTSMTDIDARNGSTYYYAVTAYDYDGNESELSRDVAYDTPRPEGMNVRITNFRTQPGLSGYDFSTYSIGVYNDQYTDVYFEYYEGYYYLNVWTDSDIKDMGYTSSLYEIGEAPASGWSPSKDVRAIPGHTYVIWTWDNHFAKIRIVALTPNQVVFDWAYQLQEGNPRLKQGVAERPALTAGPGVKERK